MQTTIPGMFAVFDRAEAEKRRDEGIDIALAGMAAIRQRVDGYIRQLASAKMPFTADHVYELADASGEPLPDGLNLGSLFNAASRRGEIEPVWSPAIPSKRPASHARALKVWQGC